MHWPMISGALAAAALSGSLAPQQVEWPQWRGPFNTGMAEGDAPLRWDADDIQWQLEIPGRGRVFALFGSRGLLLSCFDADTGTPHYQQARLPKPYHFKASPVGANGKLYLATEEGDVVVVRMGDEFEVLAPNVMDGHSFIASPVIIDGDIYLRSRMHLFRIGPGGA